jgi:ribosomal protein L7/L12
MENTQPLAEINCYALGRQYDRLGENIRNLLDLLIGEGLNKVRVIRFLRNELSLSLTEAKTLYEGRENMLKTAADPFGWR